MSGWSDGKMNLISWKEAGEFLPELSPGVHVAVDMFPFLAASSNNTGQIAEELDSQNMISPLLVYLPSGWRLLQSLPSSVWLTLTHLKPHMAMGTFPLTRIETQPRQRTDSYCMEKTKLEINQPVNKSMRKGVKTKLRNFPEPRLLFLVGKTDRRGETK